MMSPLEKEEVNFMHQYPHRTGSLKTAMVVFAIIALILAIFVSPVPAEEQSDKESEWEFKVAPYLWFLSLKGDVTVRGLESDLDIDFDKIWDELNIAAMLVFDARKGRWGVWGDIIGANLGDSSSSVGNIGIEPTIKILWLTLGGYYRLGTWGLTDSPDKNAPAVTVDAVAGARYTYLDVELDLRGLPNVDGDKDWVDPLVGVRTIWDFTRRWSVTLDGSVGGFGVGSDSAWQAFGLLGYSFGLFGEDNAKAFGGYRAWHQDYTDGSGANKFEWDVTVHGPVLGLGIEF
jgi:hypothetical protein